LTIAENRGYTALASAISGFADSTHLLFITKGKTFETERLAEQQLFHGHNYVMRSLEKTFMTRVLFIDWLQTLFIPKTDQRRIKASYN
jgi:hypothetical protein